MDQLRGLPGGGAAEAAWAAAAGPGDDCDATIVPIVAGHVDAQILDQLTAALLAHLAPPAGTHRAVSPAKLTAANATARPRRPGES